MSIKELEEKLLISRANIRFYEKEGLLSPNRKENKYRNYTEEDISRLQKVIIMRKLGISLTDIKNVFDGKETLQYVIQKQKTILSEEIEELKGALDVCEQIEKDNIDIQSFDDEHYINIIHNKENQGQSFVDICKDYVNFEIEMFGNMWKRVFFHDFNRDKKKHGFKWALLIVFLLTIIRGLCKRFIWHGSFWEGFTYPYIIFGLGSIIVFPIFALKKKHPKIAGVLANIIVISGITFLLALVIFIIVCIIMSLFR